MSGHNKLKKKNIYSGFRRGQNMPVYDDMMMATISKFRQIKLDESLHLKKGHGRTSPFYFYGEVAECWRKMSSTKADE